MRVVKYKRGQIWWYEYNGTQYDGSVMGKTRPVIIVSNDAANAFSNCLIGIPCTTQEKKDMPTHLTTSIHGTHSTILAENIISINISRLTDYIGMVDEELMHEIDNILAIAVGLKEVEKQSYTEDSVEVTSALTTDDLISPEIESPVINNIDNQSLNRIGRPAKHSREEMLRYINDYENHTIDFIIKKYELKDKKAAQQQAYLFRKKIREEDN